jgi:branched-chain amino acid transport system ATP-binding protein
MLSLESVNVHRGGIHVLWDISFYVEEAEVFAILGANGAGKTTLLEAVAGLNRTRTGKILFRGERIDTLQPHQIVAKGIALVPEGRLIFPRLTVLENLRLGAYHVKYNERIQKAFDIVFHMFPVLESRREQSGGTLSGGEQQMLAIGRALMSDPAVVMLDEPSSGLAPKIVTNIFECIENLTSEKKTVILVEQHVKKALEIADRVAVLESGRIAIEGEPSALMKKDHIREAYLGV